MNARECRGMTLLEVGAVILVLGLLGIFVARPKLFDAESRRAAEGKKATQNVEAATARTDDATAAQSAAAAAYVTTIGSANSTAPDSREKQFIAAAVPITLGYLQAPDPKKLLEAEKLKTAFLEGQVALADSLIKSGLSDAAILRKERDDAVRDRNEAQTRKREADNAISEAAAVNLAAKRNQAVMLVVIVLLAGGWLYAKIFSISPSTIGKIAADIRAGGNPIQAMDTNLAPWHHNAVNRASRLATPADDTKVVGG